MHADLFAHMDRRFLVLFKEGLPLPSEEAIRIYLDTVADLVDRDPREAGFFAHMVPLLIPHMKSEASRVHALGLAASAFAAAKDYRHASLLLDEAEALASSAALKADIYSRRLTISIALEEWKRARDLLTKARSLAAQTPTQEIQARLDVQAAGIAMFADRDFPKAARLCLLALESPGCVGRTRQAAFTNLANALKSLDPRVAHQLLSQAYRWRSIKNATFYDYVMAWIDGYVRAYVAETQEERRAARKRLCWVAEGLHAMGREADAILAALDLVALTYERRVQGQPARVVATVIKTLIEHPDTPDELRRRARRYLDDPTHPAAVQLRRICLELHGGSLFRRLSYRESQAG